QIGATLHAMQPRWAAGFPPLDSASSLAVWLAKVHTGDVFAYPCGGEGGGSTLTLLLCTTGCALLWFGRERTQLLHLMVPFAMALVAAVLNRYPYGGVSDGSPARVMQFLAPSICLLAGLGLAGLLTFFRAPQTRRRVLRAVLVVLAAIGSVPLAAEAFHP